MERDIVLLNIFYYAFWENIVISTWRQWHFGLNFGLGCHHRINEPNGGAQSTYKIIGWLLVGPWIMRWYVGWLCKYFLENNDPCDLKNRLQTVYVVCWLIVDSSFWKIVLISGIFEFRFLLPIFLSELFNKLLWWHFVKMNTESDEEGLHRMIPKLL